MRVSSSALGQANEVTARLFASNVAQTGCSSARLFGEDKFGLSLLSVCIVVKSVRDSHIAFSLVCDFSYFHETVLSNENFRSGVMCDRVSEFIFLAFIEVPFAKAISCVSVNTQVLDL